MEKYYINNRHVDKLINLVGEDQLKDFGIKYEYSSANDDYDRLSDTIAAQVSSNLQTNRENFLKFLKHQEDYIYFKENSTVDAVLSPEKHYKEDGSLEDKEDTIHRIDNWVEEHQYRIKEQSDFMYEHFEYQVGSRIDTLMDRGYFATPINPDKIREEFGDENEKFLSQFYDIKEISEEEYKNADGEHVHAYVDDKETLDKIQDLIDYGDIDRKEELFNKTKEYILENANEKIDTLYDYYDNHIDLDEYDYPIYLDYTTERYEEISEMPIDREMLERAISQTLSPVPFYKDDYDISEVLENDKTFEKFATQCYSNYCLIYDVKLHDDNYYPRFYEDKLEDYDRTAEIRNKVDSRFEEFEKLGNVHFVNIQSVDGEKIENMIRNRIVEGLQELNLDDYKEVCINTLKFPTSIYDLEERNTFLNKILDPEKGLENIKAIREKGKLDELVAYAHTEDIFEEIKHGHYDAKNLDKVTNGHGDYFVSKLSIKEISKEDFEKAYNWDPNGVDSWLKELYEKEISLCLQSTDKGEERIFEQFLHDESFFKEAYMPSPELVKEITDKIYEDNMIEEEIPEFLEQRCPEFDMKPGEKDILGIKDSLERASNSLHEIPKEKFIEYATQSRHTDESALESKFYRGFIVHNVLEDVFEENFIKQYPNVEKVEFVNKEADLKSILNEQIEALDNCKTSIEKESQSIENERFDRDDYER